MSNEELNELIAWCRKKINLERTKPYRMNAKALDGYVVAMQAVMSHLHKLKEVNDEQRKAD